MAVALRSDASAVRVSQALALASGVAAVLAVVGWYRGWTTLLRAGTQGTAIQFNTAISLACASVAIVAALRGWRRWTAVAALPPLVFASFTLAEYLFSLTAGVDTFLFVVGVPRTMAPMMEHLASQPGRMAPETAFAALLLVAGAMLLAVRRGRWMVIAAVVCGFVAAGLGVVWIFDYASGMDVPTQWVPVTRMSPYTAMLLAALGISELLASVPVVRAAHATPLVVPPLVACAGAVLSFGAWRMLTDRRDSDIREALRQQTRVLVAEIGVSLEGRVIAVERLAHHAGYVDAAIIRREASLEPTFYPAIDLLAWLEPSGDVRWMDARDAVTPATLASVRAVADAARRLDTTQVVTNFPFDTQHRAVLIAAPIGAWGLEGVLVGRLRLSEAVNRILAPYRSVPGGFMAGGMIIRDSRGVLYASPGAPARRGDRAEAELRLRNMTLSVSVWPSDEWMATMTSNAPMVALILGCLISLVAAVAFRQGYQSRSRATALAKSTRLLDDMQRASKTGGWEYDVATGRVSWTDEVYRIHEVDAGFDPNDASRNMDFFLDRPAMERAFRDALERGTPYDLELQLRTAKARVIWVRTSARPELRDGRPVRLVGHITDITGLKRAEEALRAASRYARTLIEASLDPLVTISPEGVITDVNAATESATGLRREALVGTEFATYFTDPALARRGYEQVLATGSVRDYALTLRHASGTTTDVLYNATVYRNAAGGVEGVFAAARDVTERRLLEESLRQRTEELERSNRELERFAYAASHDMQEPLRMVVSFTRLLERKYADRLDAQAREYIAYAAGGAVQMQQLIESLLAYSRVGTRGQDFAPVETEHVFDQAVHNLGVAIAESGATVTHDPLPRVRGDAMQILQVLQNLIGNAIKFRRPDVAPVVHVSATEHDRGWEFTVSDNGIGIDRQYFDRVFVLFQRLHGRGDYPGTGMGLSICKRVVERHGGHIWITSTPGAGSVFHFTLPRINDAGDLTHVAAADASYEGGGRHAATAAAGPHGGRHPA